MPPLRRLPPKPAPPASLQALELQAMRDAGMITLALNPGFLTKSDASELRPEAAGLGVAMLGSAYMMLIVLVLALPIGVAASVYLEEIAPKNRWTDIIEINIANLAAVPSIVYGILALALFINIIGLPQSAPIVGGLVLTLMTLPTIIIATRAARSAPPGEAGSTPAVRSFLDFLGETVPVCGSLLRLPAAARTESPPYNAHSLPRP